MSKIVTLLNINFYSYKVKFLIAALMNKYFVAHSLRLDYLRLANRPCPCNYCNSNSAQSTLNYYIYDIASE